jgi:hypothetical protein
MARPIGINNEVSSNGFQASNVKDVEPFSEVYIKVKRADEVNVTIGEDLEK